LLFHHSDKEKHQQRGCACLYLLDFQVFVRDFLVGRVRDVADKQKGAGYEAGRLNIAYSF
jgi:hypothetical protein